MLESLAKNEFRNLFILLLAYASLSLGVAYILQYQFGFKPCNLCMLARYSTFSLAALSALALFWRNVAMRVLIILNLISMIIIYCYHVGVERGIFLEPIKCQITMDLELASNCHEVTVRILGLSLAEIGALLSCVILCVVMTLITRRQ